ncbi:MAG: hypothetical protein Q9214_002014, partial [Letrouitia sp. 1 TL-2023]
QSIATVETARPTGSVELNPKLVLLNRSTISEAPIPPTADTLCQLLKTELMVIKSMRKSRLEPMARYEDEEHNKADSYQDSEEQDHQSTSVHQFPNVRFSNARPIHERVLAKACQSEHRIDGVLLGRQRIDANRKR